MIFDNYFPEKINILGLKVVSDTNPKKNPPLNCSIETDIVLCTATRIITPGEKMTVIYDASVKEGVTGNIISTATLCAPYTDKADRTIPACIPFDTMDSNNEPTINIKVSPLSAIPG